MSSAGRRSLCHATRGALVAPTVSGLDYSYGLPNLIVNVTGTHLDVAGLAATLDSTPCIVQAVNATTCQVQIPAGSAGFYALTVSTNGGSAAPVSFEIIGVPVLTSIDPVIGPFGTPVTLIGNNFPPQDSGNLTAKIQGAGLDGLTVVNRTTITGTVPSIFPGLSNVEVTTDAGSDDLPNGFTAT